MPGFIARSCGRSCWLRSGKQVERHHRRAREILLEDVALDDRDLAGDAGALGVAPRERREFAVVFDAHRRRAELFAPRRWAAGRRRRRDRRRRRRSWSSPSPASARPWRPAWAATSRPCPAGAGAGDRDRRRIAGNPARGAGGEAEDDQRRKAEPRQGAHRASATRREVCATNVRTSVHAPSVAHCSISAAARAGGEDGSTRSWNLRARSASVIGRSRLPIACWTNVRNRRPSVQTIVTSADASPIAGSAVATDARPQGDQVGARHDCVGEFRLARLAEQDARRAGMVDAELALETRARRSLAGELEHQGMDLELDALDIAGRRAGSRARVARSRRCTDESRCRRQRACTC